MEKTLVKFLRDSNTTGDPDPTAYPHKYSDPDYGFFLELQLLEKDKKSSFYSKLFDFLIFHITSGSACKMQTWISLSLRERGVLALGSIQS
jgi:hypothetical protein